MSLPASCPCAPCLVFRADRQAQPGDVRAASSKLFRGVHVRERAPASLVPPPILHLLKRMPGVSYPEGTRNTRIRKKRRVSNRPCQTTPVACNRPKAIIDRAVRDSQCVTPHIQLRRDGRVDCLVSCTVTPIPFHSQADALSLHGTPAPHTAEYIPQGWPHFRAPQTRGGCVCACARVRVRVF